MLTRVTKVVNEEKSFLNHQDQSRDISQNRPYPIKSLGQNYLQNRAVISQIVAKLELKDSDNLLEIGPGPGAFTSLISQNKFNKYFLVEIDERFNGNLSKILEKNSLHYDIINQNFLDYDLTTLTKEISPLIVFGAIPYNITSPILHTILKLNIRPKVVVLVVQKEFAEKLLSQNPRANYWTYATLGYSISKIVTIKAQDFYPVPKVDSMAIKMVLDPTQDDLLQKIGFRKWEKFLHHIYKNPRKMINKVFDKETLNKLGISPDIRPQNLSLQDMIKLLDNSNIK